jgi:hypothetical protein
VPSGAVGELGVLAFAAVSAGAFLLALPDDPANPFPRSNKGLTPAMKCSAEQRQPIGLPGRANPCIRPPIVLAVVPQSARLASLTRRRVAIKLSCNEACTARATLRLGRAVLAGGSATLGEANVGRLRLRTTAAQRRAIRRMQRSRTRRRAATLTLTFTDRVGNRRTLTRRLKLIR